MRSKKEDNSRVPLAINSCDYLHFTNCNHCRLLFLLPLLRSYVKNSIIQMFLIATLLLFFPFAFAVHSVDSKGAKIEMEFISSDQLCLLCNSLLNRWKGQVTANEQQFRTDLLTSCALLDNPEQAKQCQARVTDERVERLRKDGAEQLCVAEGFCQKGQYERLERKRAKEDARKGKKPAKEMPTIPDVVLVESGNVTKTIGNETSIMGDEESDFYIG